MRDLLVTAIVLGALPFAMRHVWAGVLLWTWLSLMNPHRLAFGFAYSAPFAAIAAGATFIAILFNLKRMKLPLSAPVIMIVLMVFWMCITTIFAFHPGPSSTQLVKVLKIQLFTLIAMAALHERKHIEYFIWINVLSLAFFGVKGGIYTVLSGGGGRVWGPPGGFIGGNNELALALVMVIPLMNYLRLTTRHRHVRLGLLMAMGITAVSVLGSQSRGAFLAIAAMGFVLWLRSSKKLVSAVVLGVAAVGLLAFMPDTWTERMRTIQTYEEDGSAMGRIRAWEMTANVAADRITGGGYDIYTEDLYARYMPEQRKVLVAHSIYFSMLGEHGYPGLLLFLGVWVSSWFMAARLRRISRKQPELQWVYHLAGMCQVSMAGYLVGGAFLSLAYFDLPYNIVAILVTTSAWVKAERWRTETTGAFGSGAPQLRRREVVAVPARV
ncbi:putative O-glycosylation ligase, exosortase A system-associated [Pseudorhodoferax sp.]|uniref:putative O-glycosylation ligase, exosortase A system-associated n=1 Tax=Pseudorhodoferax sp. TaxID=1993553 RepID=UPI002DD64C74|nr:putative O-glycosylation ligase, exosortase A system-associated [Pseudorhodoferax sp.]